MKELQLKSTYLNTTRLQSRLFAYACILLVGVLLSRPFSVSAQDADLSSDSTSTVEDAAQPTVQTDNPAITADRESSPSSTPVASITASTDMESTPLNQNASATILSAVSPSEATATPQSNNAVSNDPDSSTASSTPPEQGAASGSPDSLVTATTTPLMDQASATPVEILPPCLLNQGPSGNNLPGDASATNSSDATTTASTDSSLGNPADPLFPACDQFNPSASATVPTLDATNNNNVNSTTTATSTADTGHNQIKTDRSVDGSGIFTGEINVYANVLTIANTNLVNSDITRVAENFNSLANDLYLNQAEISDSQRMQSLADGLCGQGDVSCQSISSFDLANQNFSGVQNNVAALGNSGNNNINASGTVSDSQISTGNVNAVVNILNIVNVNLVNSRWTIVTFNVFGNFTGNLVLPSELYFINSMSLGSGNTLNLASGQKVSLNISNDNAADIQNNINVNAGTGNNSISAGQDAQPTVATDQATSSVDSILPDPISSSSTPVSAPDNSGQSSATTPSAVLSTPGNANIASSSITSGNAVAEAQVQNFSNLNLYNSQWFLSLVNILGSWTGGVYSQPDNVVMATTTTGFSFASVSGVDSSLLSQMQNCLDGKNADSCQVGQPASLGQADQNNAAIINNVSVGAGTGNNQIQGRAGVNGSNIQTGNALALANVLNFANANLVDANFSLGLVNIFGNWNGSVVFGYPDLSVGQQLSQQSLPQYAGRQFGINVFYGNDSGSSMAGTRLTWQFDPSSFALATVNSPFPYQQTASGTLEFDLGTQAPQSSGQIQIQLENEVDQYLRQQKTFTASIDGAGPELNLANNQSVLTLQVGDDPLGSGGGIVTNYDQLKITKTNDAAQAVVPGQSVNFAITLSNLSSEPLYGITVYDQLTDYNQDTLKSQSFSVGTMLPNDEVAINYSLDLSPSAAAGVYTNFAYAQGITSAQVAFSTGNASSSFVIAVQQGFIGQDPQATTTAVATLLATSAPPAPGQVLSESDFSKAKKPVIAIARRVSPLPISSFSAHHLSLPVPLKTTSNELSAQYPNLNYWLILYLLLLICLVLSCMLAILLLWRKQRSALNSALDQHQPIRKYVSDRSSGHFINTQNLSNDQAIQLNDRGQP